MSSVRGSWDTHSREVLDTYGLSKIGFFQYIQIRYFNLSQTGLYCTCRHCVREKRSWHGPGARLHDINLSKFTMSVSELVVRDFFERGYTIW